MTQSLFPTATVSTANPPTQSSGQNGEKTEPTTDNPTADYVSKDEFIAFKADVIGVLKEMRDVINKQNESPSAPVTQPTPPTAQPAQKNNVIGDISTNPLVVQLAGKLLGGKTDIKESALQMAQLYGSLREVLEPHPNPLQRYMEVLMIRGVVRQMHKSGLAEESDIKYVDKITRKELGEDEYHIIG